MGPNEETALSLAVELQTAFPATDIMVADNSVEAERLMVKYQVRAMVIEVDSPDLLDFFLRARFSEPGVRAIFLCQNATAHLRRVAQQNQVQFVFEPAIDPGDLVSALGYTLAQVNLAVESAA